MFTATAKLTGEYFYFCSFRARILQFYNNLSLKLDVSSAEKVGNEKSGMIYRVCMNAEDIATPTLRSLGTQQLFCDEYI